MRKTVASKAMMQTRSLDFGLAVLVLNLSFLPQGSGGVWFTGEVSLLTQRAGFIYNFMPDRLGCLKNEGGCLRSSCLLRAISLPHTWRTTCCALSVCTGNHMVPFYTLKVGIWVLVGRKRRYIFILISPVFQAQFVNKDFHKKFYLSKCLPRRKGIFMSRHNASTWRPIILEQ